MLLCSRALQQCFDHRIRLRNHAIVAAGERHIIPTRFGPRLRLALVEDRQCLAGAGDVGLGHAIADRMSKPRRLDVSRQRMVRDPAIDPGDIRGVADAEEARCIHRRRELHHHGLEMVPRRIPDRRGDALRCEVRLAIGPALAVFRHLRIEIDQTLQPLGPPIRDHRDDDACVAVTDENDVLQLLTLDNGDDVLAVRLQPDRRGEQMPPFAEARERRREHVVAGRAQPFGHLAPAPAAMC